ncbi:hypothetical protein EV401DRAFT_1914815, partial [Pisolithus croceorrhizus]
MLPSLLAIIYLCNLYSNSILSSSVTHLYNGHYHTHSRMYIQYLPGSTATIIIFMIPQPL